MRQFLLTTFAACISVFSYSQFYSETFEGGGTSWMTTGPTIDNDWRTSTCAGNGVNLPGTQALYISKGGTQPGCGADGVDQYAYENSSSGSVEIIRYTQIDATCYANLTFDFEHKIQEEMMVDVVDFVTSTDGINWVHMVPMPTATAWTSTGGSFPGSFDNSTFYIGFRFTYNDNTIAGIPPAIDNVQISGSDNTAPNVLCPSNKTFYSSNLDCSVALQDYSDSLLVTDICNDTIVTVFQAPSPGTMISPVGSPHTITMTVMDGSGNSTQCQFEVAVLDTIVPDITCPIGPESEYLDANCELLVPDYTSAAISTDNCESFFALTLTQAPPAGSTIGDTTSITITATDNFGNSNSCAFTLNTIDTISPTITCPANDTVGTSALCSTNISDYTSFGVPVDNCTFAGSIGITQLPSPTSLISAGSNTITLTALDASGNSGTCVFNVVVEDQTPPIITSCAPNQTVIVDDNCEGTLGDYTSLVSPTDNCTHLSNMTFAQSPAAGTLISATTLVTVTVTDENGNSTDCQFSALLNDTTAPLVTCPVDFSLAIDLNCEYLIPDITGSVAGSDNCSSFANMNVSQFPTFGSTGEGITNVTLLLTDENGNFSTCQTTISPIDTIAPTISCPSPAPIDNGSLCDYSMTYYGSSAIILDNCSGFTIDQSPAAGTVIQTGTTQVTLTVTDAGGNNASCNFNLQVFEDVPPTINCPSDTAICDPIVSYSLPTYNDNCVAELVQTDVSGLTVGSTFPVGVTTLEYTAIDSSGNMATCNFDVEILPFADPAIIQDDTLGLCNQSSALVQADSIGNGTGLWTVISGSGSFNNEFAYATGVNGIGLGTNIFVWTVTSPSCGSNSDTLIVINSQADLPASTQDTLLACTDPTITLQGNAPLFGIGSWSTTSSGIIDDHLSASTFATLTENGWHSFVWTITNTGCPTTSDTVAVLSLRSPQITPQDTLICLEANEVNVAVHNVAAGQSILWYSTSSSVSFASPDAMNSSVSGFGTTPSEIICQLSYPGCVSTADTLIVNTEICEGFNPEIPTVMTPGNLDGKNDLFNIDLLNILHPECHVTIFNRWGSVVYESIGYSEPWNGTYQGALLPMGTYFYKIELNDDSEQVLTGDISIIH